MKLEVAFPLRKILAIRCKNIPNNVGFNKVKERGYFKKGGREPGGSAG